MARLIVGMSGASGSVLTRMVLHWLARSGHEVHFVASKAGLYTASIELGAAYGRASAFIDDLAKTVRARVTIYRNSEIGAPIASGSFPCDGMVVVPCSMASLGAVAMGISDNLLRRSAEVTLKERRRLVMVARETPLSETHLENMLRLTRMGAVMLPPVPAWYLKPQSLIEMEHSMVARMCDLLGVEGPPVQRWDADQLMNLS